MFDRHTGTDLAKKFQSFPTTSWKNSHRPFGEGGRMLNILPSRNFGVKDLKLPQYGQLKFISEIEILNQVKNSNLIDYSTPETFPGIQKKRKSDDFPGEPGNRMPHLPEAKYRPKRSTLCVHCITWEFIVGELFDMRTSGPARNSPAVEFICSADNNVQIELKFRFLIPFKSRLLKELLMFSIKLKFLSNISYGVSVFDVYRVADQLRYCPLTLDRDSKLRGPSPITLVCFIVQNQ
ncbi:hypothetical protein TNCV_751891 [Trichonephila clavipes]|uniref:Uncharacterized protein n=1 Tax=Trichonephila clavipes TaxID=2585209 RepID=A0A8X6WBT4_TRICX|nr:hypothetical protein TNCV_751891 [Trichonephila clavipes]